MGKAMTQIILFDNNSVHIDGYKSIINFNSEFMCVKCKDKVLKINGKNLQIDSFTEVYMVISGQIDSICWVN